MHDPIESNILGMFNIFFRDPTVEITPYLFYPLGSSKSDLRHCRPPTVATYVSSIQHEPFGFKSSDLC